MAKRLKEDRDAGGFAMEEEEKKRGVGKERKKKGNTVGTIYTHPLNFLIPKKRQHWEKTSHWLYLKGERKEETQKKKGEGEKKGEQKRNRDKTLL